MKKILISLLALMILSGCTKIENNVSDYNTLIANVLNEENNYVNNVSVGYEYYLPKGAMVLENSDYNQTFKIMHTNIYLYVDIVSYYYKNKLNLNTSDNHYYYKEILDNGYLQIDKTSDNRYFVKIVYNYAKVEFYTNEENLNSLITYSMIILNSINYNDTLIESLLKDNSVTNSEIAYELDGTSQNNSFSQLLSEYINVEEETNLPDE